MANYNAERTVEVFYPGGDWNVPGARVFKLRARDALAPVQTGTVVWYTWLSRAMPSASNPPPAFPFVGVDDGALPSVSNLTDLSIVADFRVGVE